MTTNKQIEILAKQMGVTAGDVMSMARNVASAIKQDGVKETFVSSSNEDQVKFAQAYAKSEATKYQNFCTSLITNQEKKEAIEAFVYSELA